MGNARAAMRGGRRALAGRERPARLSPAGLGPAD